MALKLDERPGHKYDSDGSGDTPWRPPGFDEDNSGYDEKNPESKAAKSIGEQEAGASTSDGQNTEKNTKEGGLYRPSPSGRRGKNKSSKIKITKKQGYIGGGIAGLLIAGLIATATIVSGPLQIMQFANLLDKFHFTGNNSLTEGRLGNVYRYLKYSDPDNIQNRRVGAIARRSSAKVEAEFRSKGLDPVWNRGRLVGFNIDPANLDALRSAGLDIPQGDVDFMPIDGPGTTAGTARSRLSNVVDVVGALDAKVGAIGARNLRTKAGVRFADVSVKRTTQNLNANIRESRAEARTVYEDGVKADVEAETGTGRVDTGQDTTNEDGETTRTTTDTADIDGKSSARTSLDAATRSATKGIAVVGLVCAAYQLADSANELRLANTIQPLMRFGMRVLTVSSQIQAGGDAVDLQALGFLAEDMYDASAAVGAQSWREAGPIQANLGENITGPSIPDSAHPTNGGNFLLNAFNGIPGFGVDTIEATCGAVNSLAGQVISYAIGFTPAGFVADVVGDQVIAALFAAYGDDLVALLAGEVVDTSTFVGATFGAAADFGVMLASNEAMLSLGGRVLSAGEVFTLNQRNAEEEKKEMESKGIFERYFALSNPESLFAQSVTTTASLSKPSRVVNNISTAKYTDSLGSTFSSLFVNNTYAQSAPTYFYNVDQIGFSAEELDDPRYQNPFENEEIVAPLLQENKDKIEKCFGLELRSDNSLVPIEGAVKVVDKDRESNGCNNTDEDWTRIRFYIVDHNVASSYDCKESGDPVSCEAVGFRLSPATAAGPGGTNLAAPGLNGYAVPCTGQPTPVVRINTPGSEHSDWSQLESSGVIGTDSSGNDINVYIREACDTTNPKTILIVSSIHGSENGGQFIGHELLYNRDLPDDVRIIVIPEMNKTGIVDRDNGGVQRGGYFNTGRVNANGVNLNRNSDFDWSEMNGPANTSTTGSDARNYRGPAPNSEPETQAVQNFIQSLGDISLTLHYHDILFYVAPVGNTSFQIAQTYADASGMHGQCPGEGANPSSTPCAIRAVNQNGSLDAWQAQTTGNPVLLVELSDNLSDPVMSRNVDGIMAIINGGLLQ